MTVKRKAHSLKPTTGNTRPRRVIFFDTETNFIETPTHQTVHTLKFGIAKFCVLDPDGCYEVKKTLRFTQGNDLITWIDRIAKKKSKLTIISHNLKFDLWIVGAIPRLAVCGWSLGSWFNKGQTSIFRWKKDKSIIQGLDNGNLFRGKLEAWGGLVDLPKLDIDFKQATDKELDIYCERDVDIMIALWNLWIHFIDAHECGSFKPTIASTAMGAWRHKYLTDKVHIHCDENALVLERASYHGGRTECLWVGKSDRGPFYYLDVNNMYGHVMSTKIYPAGLYAFGENLTLYELAYKLARYAVIARVTINIDEPVFPIKQDGHTVYPVGEFTTVLTTPELKYCIDHSWLVMVHEAAWYRTAPLFQDYILDFHRFRQQYKQDGNQGFEKICKLLINGLYGKFGQKAFHQEIIGTCDPHIMERENVYNAKTGEYCVQTSMGGNIYREWSGGESYASFPAIAAHVTAEARLLLWSLMKKVPSGHLFYVDTDSLVTDAVGYESLEENIQPDRLGELKVELTSPWLEINAPKDYRMERRTRVKGIRQDAIMTSPGTYQQEQWFGLSGLQRAGVTEGYVTKTITKHQSRVIHSGVVAPSGWIRPFVLAQD